MPKRWPTDLGQLTLIDLDMVAESNTNRQIHALDDIYGKAKVDAIAERIQRINPDCSITCIEDFVTEENLDRLLGRDFDVVIDAIDQARVKVAMVAYCKNRKLPIVVAGAAGGQIDPTQIRLTDLSQTVQDPLLAKKSGPVCAANTVSATSKNLAFLPFSTEPLRYPEKTNGCDAEAGPTGLSCASLALQYASPRYSAWLPPAATAPYVLSSKK